MGADVSSVSHSPRPSGHASFESVYGFVLRTMVLKDSGELAPRSNSGQVTKKKRETNNGLDDVEDYTVEGVSPSQAARRNGTTKNSAAIPMANAMATANSLNPNCSCSSAPSSLSTASVGGEEETLEPKVQRFGQSHDTSDERHGKGFVFLRKRLQLFDVR